MIDFRNKKMVPPLALTAALVWGAAYPFIKIGVDQFGIAADDTAGKTLFAGVRFLLAGLVVLVMASLRGVKLACKKEDFSWLVLYAFVNTALHYFCFYIGVSNSAGSRASVLNSLSTFLLVFLSCAFFPQEHLSSSRIFGCVIGFAGLLLLNLGGGMDTAFRWSGDGMIIANAVCSAFGGILTRIVGRKMNALFMTGAGLFAGGGMLVAAGLCMGGMLTRWTLSGCLVLLILIGISVIGFSIYNQLMQYHPVGKVGIYNSLIPVFGVTLSCLLLGEPFLVKYVAAAGLVAVGVYVIQREK